MDHSFFSLHCLSNHLFLGNRQLVVVFFLLWHSNTDFCNNRVNISTTASMVEGELFRFDDIELIVRKKSRDWRYLDIFSSESLFYIGR